MFKELLAIWGTNVYPLVLNIYDNEGLECSKAVQRGFVGLK